MDAISPRASGYKRNIPWKYRPDGLDGARDTWIHQVQAQTAQPSTTESLYWSGRLQQHEHRGKYTHCNNGNVTTAAAATKVVHPKVPSAAKFETVPLPPINRIVMTPSRRTKVEASNKELSDKLMSELQQNNGRLKRPV